MRPAPAPIYDAAVVGGGAAGLSAYGCLRLGAPTASDDERAALWAILDQKPGIAHSPCIISRARGGTHAPVLRDTP
jgi:hypothetical protein